MKHNFTGEVTTDRIIRIDGMRYNGSVLEGFVGKELSITIDTKKKPRSVQQNAWFWGVAIPTIIARLKEFDGEEYTKEVIHEYILTQIIQTSGKVVRILGTPIVSYDNKTTSKMNTTEFNAFKDELQKFFAERDIQIPDPNE